jgi:AraC-like DNA-binding protein
VPHPLTARAPVAGDALAALLDLTGLAGQVYCRTKASAPWGLALEARGEVYFHVVLEGACTLGVGAARWRLLPGDIVLLPHGAGHTLADPPTSRKVGMAEWRSAHDAHGRLVLERKGGGAAALLVCGAYRLESEDAHPLLRVLPPVIQVSAAPGRGRDDIEATLSALAREFERSDVGSAAVVARLLEVLFVQVLRAWLDQQPQGATGWLGALRDPQIGRAVSLLHDRPARRWTLAGLAGEVGMSRAALARRFVARVGEPPLAYLTRVRMQRAARLLAATDRPLASIADAVGYRSEYAFNRAFRRARGLPPGEFRRRRAGSPIA